MIRRSHRVDTITGDPPSGVTQTVEKTLLNVAEIDLRPKVKVFAPGTPPPPQVGLGEG